MRALNRILVWSATEWKPGELSNLVGAILTETRSGVDTGSNGCATKRQAIDIAKRIVDAFQIFAQHRGVTRPFLAKRNRRGVLHVCATNLHDVLPAFSFCRNCVA